MQSYPDGSQQPQQPQQPQLQFVAVQPYPVGGQPPAGGQQQFQFVQAQPLNPQEGGAVIIGQVVPVPKNRFYRVKAAKVLGTMQIILAILAIIMGTITIVVGARTAWIGMSIWGGFAFFLPAGILGVISGKPTNMQSCVINSCLVMSILSFIVAISIHVMAVIVATQEVYVDDYGNEHTDSAKVSYWALTALVGLVEMVVSVTQCAYCCRGRCCRPSEEEMMQFAPQHRYLAQPNQNMPPVMAYPVRLQGQLQQQEQFQFQQYQMPSTGSQRVRFPQGDIAIGNIYTSVEKEKPAKSDEDSISL